MHTRYNPSPLPTILRVIFGLVILSTIFYLLSPVFGDLAFTLIFFFVALGAVTILGSVIDCRFKVFELDDANIIFTVGMFTIKKALVPFAQITNVIVTRSFLERICGLGSVVIDTPGGSTLPEIEVHSISYEAIKILISKTQGKKLHS